MGIESDYSHIDLSRIAEVDYTTLLISLARYKYVISFLSKEDRVLEIGCSTGYGTYYLSQFCKDVVGTDISENMIANAKRQFHAPNLEFQHTDIVQNPSLISERDFIVCFEVIQDMPRDEIRYFLEVINRNKRHDSVLFLSTPRRLPPEMLTQNRLKYHPFEYSYEELKEDLNSVFRRSLILGQLDETIGSLHRKNIWTFFCICF